MEIKQIKVGSILKYKVQRQRKDNSLFLGYANVEVVSINETEIKVKGISNLIDTVTGIVLFDKTTICTTNLSAFNYFFN